MTRPAALALAAAAVGVVGGCTSHRHGLTTAAVVQSGQHCGGQSAGPSARWIGDEPGLRAALSQKAALAVPVDAPPRVNFSRDGVLAISAGTRPTAGYSVALHEPAVTIADGVATVIVRMEEPAPGAMLAQVMTSPCVLVRLPREGIREVRVIDAAGRLLAIAATR